MVRRDKLNIPDIFLARWLRRCIYGAPALRAIEIRSTDAASDAIVHMETDLMPIPTKCQSSVTAQRLAR